jgi:hypothetical protein
MYATFGRVHVNLAECLSIHPSVTKSMHPLNLGLQPTTNGRVTGTNVRLAVDRYFTL